MGRLKSWESIVAAMLVAAFWVLVLSVPETADPWPTWVRVIVGIGGAIAVLFGAGGVMWCIYNDQRDRIWMFAIVALLGIVVGVSAAIAGSPLDLEPNRRLAIGVGGTAIAGLVYGITRFDTIRAAASVPVIILLIGTATWPDASELIGQDVRTEIFKWMGVVLAASGLGEAAAQVGRQRTQAELGPDVEVSGGGDLARADDAKNPRTDTHPD